MVVSAFAEVASLGAVLPFLGILTDPDRVLSQPVVADIAEALGIDSADELVLPLTVAFMTLALLAAAIRILLLRVSTRLAFTTGADLGVEVYRRTLYQPYPAHAARNSSEVISGTTIKTDLVASKVLMPLLTLVSSALLFLAITAALIVVDPVVALLATIGFGLAYLGISLLSRGRLSRNSRRVAKEQTRVIRVLQEGLGGIRDVLLDGTQPLYADIYGGANHRLKRAQGNNVFLAQSPRFAMEAMGMLVIAALAYGMSRQDGGITSALPVLGALALGAQRLIPALQQSYGSWARIVGNYASLADVVELLDQPLPPEATQPAPAPLAFEAEIRCEGVRFRYSSDEPWVLDALDLTIPKGARIGFVGSTGSGKSTVFDLLMGLLQPTEGKLLVDGRPLRGERLRAWQQTIAHVPQSIYLADTTFAENIAFGVAPDMIDTGRVMRVARQAQIADFIESRPDGYQGLAGERGIRLSGGQRQRIGIARALYRRASVLLLDEATSALDTSTEQSVMDAIEGLDRNLTILMIAHRLTTVQRCDLIVELEGARVVAKGTYEELLERSTSFRNRIQAAGT